MKFRLPPLGNLRTFEAAGRLLSFKAASEEMHVTPSAVSHAIQSLEAWLGVTLFVRTPKGIALTRAGAAYLDYVSEALQLLARGTQGLPGFSSRNALSVSCAPTFASRWLLPNLHSFRATHPELTLSIDTAHRRVAFPGDEVDLAIRHGEGPWPDLAATPLADERLVPVASPDYLAINGRLDGPGEHARHTLLRVGTVTEDWPGWFDAVDFGEAADTKELWFDALHLALDAAIHGLGIALGRRPLIDADLASGRLVEAGGPTTAARTKHWLIGSPESAKWPEVSAFREWLVARFGSVTNAGPRGG